MEGIIVIVAYRPKPGKETELLELVRNRVPTLRKEGLVTDRKPTIMRARDGTIIEVSEWKSQEAIDAAHKNPNVLAMWDKFFKLCDCVPLKDLRSEGNVRRVRTDRRLNVFELHRVLSARISIALAKRV
jgi:quinol monooxygenase YgiN